LRSDQGLYAGRAWTGSPGAGYAYHARVTVDVGAGIHTADSRSITVTQAGKLWLASREAAGVERATLINYREHLDLHITPLIGATKRAVLSVPFVREFEDRLRQDRSPAMVCKVLVSLSGILADAQDRGLVAQNVVRNRRSHQNGLSDARQKRRLAPTSIRSSLPPGFAARRPPESERFLWTDEQQHRVAPAPRRGLHRLS
jgi:hypothetical protein